jgi:hypothetical protein
LVECPGKLGRSFNQGRAIGRSRSVQTRVGTSRRNSTRRLAMLFTARPSISKVLGSLQWASSSIISTGCGLVNTGASRARLSCCVPSRSVREQQLRVLRETLHAILLLQSEDACPGSKLDRASHDRAPRHGALSAIHW